MNSFRYLRNMSNRTLCTSLSKLKLSVRKGPSSVISSRRFLSPESHRGFGTISSVGNNDNKNNNNNNNKRHRTLQQFDTTQTHK
mmetsp:Transcript_48692/g.54245  ORF Transcript_48692/g.54245 Transcript_48692/m.54245 type:complete len:84 (-) Transcript_48692:327-578(-)